jgi:hypothetical protein
MAAKAAHSPSSRHPTASKEQHSSSTPVKRSHGATAAVDTSDTQAPLCKQQVSWQRWQQHCHLNHISSSSPQERSAALSTVLDSWSSSVNLYLEDSAAGDLRVTPELLCHLTLGLLWQFGLGAQSGRDAILGPSCYTAGALTPAHQRWLRQQLPAYFAELENPYAALSDSDDDAMETDSKISSERGGCLAGGSSSCSSTYSSPGWELWTPEELQHYVEIWAAGRGGGLPTPPSS